MSRVRRATRLLTAAIAVTAAGTLVAFGTGVLAGHAGAAPTAAEVPVLQAAVQAEPPVGATMPVPAPVPPPCEATALACVRLSSSQAWLRPPGGAVVGPVPIGYGIGAHATPTGVFHVSWKAASYTSRTYHEPMPHAVFFAAGGIAFHEGSLDTSSHGCVHLAADTAAEFFAALQPGDEVQVLP